MAKSSFGKVGRTYVPLNTEIKVHSVMLADAGINKWQSAINAARAEINPRRRELYELYTNILLDGHLTSVVEKRKLALTNKRVLWITDEDKEPNPIIEEKVLNAPWFYDLRMYAVEAVAWGHSLVELIPGTDGFIDKAMLINRINVRPEPQYGYLLFNYGADIPRIDFRTDPYYTKYLVEFGREKDLGLLMQAAQYVIYKRGGFGDASQFAELFGMPFRVGKYNPYDDESRRKLNAGLEAMGGAGHAVIPEGTSLEFFSNNQSGSKDIYEFLIDACNAEISKIFLGQTMTTDNGSSRSQSEVHKQVEDEILAGDIIMTEYRLNHVLKPRLIELGYPLQNGHFKIDNTPVLSQEALLKIYAGVNSKVAIAKDDYYTNFNIRKPEAGEEVVEPMPPPAELKQDKEQPGNKPAAEKKNHYSYLNNSLPVAVITDADLSDQERQLLNKLEAMAASGQKYDQATYEATINQLYKALDKGFGGQPAYDTEDYQCKTLMEININRFGFDKNIAQVQELNRIFRETKSFSEFKEQALGVMEQYNINYLKTEYDTAFAVAQNASSWIEQKREQKDFPYLKYQTAGDNRVRAEHAALDGKIFAVDGEAVRAIYPPNGYGCRCEMVQMRADEVDMESITDKEKAIALLGDDWDRMVKSGFDNNRGETQQVFDLNKTYLSQLKGEKVDINSLDYTSINLPAYASMDKTKMPQIDIDKLATPESLQKEFANKAVRYGNTSALRFKDYSGRDVLFMKSEFDKHLKGEYLKQNRHQLFVNVDDVLSNPDEVWFTEGKGVARYYYIKYYQDRVMVCPAEVQLKRDKVIQVRSWFQMYDDNHEKNYRKGVLLKKKG